MYTDRRVMVITGIVIVVATFIAIIKQFETRLVLLLSGLLMCFIGGQLGAGTTAFVKELTNPGLVPTICTVLGFSYVMEYTKCTEHMVYFISAGLKKMTKIIIPGAVIITFLINIALPTAAGCAAAVGALLIPALIRSGVHPAMAGSAIFLGTWGSSLSPGLMFNPQVAQLAGVDVMTVIASFSMQAIIGIVVAAILLNIVAIVKKEHTGYVMKNDTAAEGKEFKVNYFYAIIPIIPLVLLVLGSKQVAAWFPYFREMLRIENLCRLVGFDERQTATLVKGKPLEYAGELYSEEHGRKFTTEKAGFQVLKDPTDGTRLVLAIDRKPIAEWFKEQFEKLRQNIRRPIQLQRKNRGI